MPQENDPLFIIGQLFAAMLFAGVVTGALLIAYHLVKNCINGKN